MDPSLIALCLLVGAPSFISALLTFYKVRNTSKSEQVIDSQKKIGSSSLIEFLLHLDQKTRKEALDSLSTEQTETLSQLLRQELEHSNSYKVSIENASGEKIAFETSAYRAEEILFEPKKKQVENLSGPAIAG